MRNVLLICPMFYDYHQNIIKLLQKKGWNVFFKNEVPLHHPSIYYIIEKIFPFLKRWMWNKYSNNIIDIIKNNNIHSVFIIRGMFLPEKLLVKIKTFSHINIIHYQWDSVKNNTNALTITKYSDVNYTFDKSDSKQYSQFQYLPLFYYWDDDCLSERVAENSPIDILFVASWSEDRFKELIELERFCKAQNLFLYVYLFIPFQTYLKLKIKGKNLPNRYMHYKSLSRKEYYRLVMQSRIIYDVPSKKQSGATVRTFETLSLKKKLLTTNISLKDEPFYSNNNIAFWNYTYTDITSLISSSYDETSLKNIYSLYDWLTHIGF